MKHAYTIDPEARYLDYERVIRDLAQAEREHELDAAGVIERLGEAYTNCQAAVDRLKLRAAEAERASYAYNIARGKYLAEIKRRVLLPEGRGNLGDFGRMGWSNWCKNNRVGPTFANACIAAASGDLAPMAKIRTRNIAQKRASRARPTFLKIKSMWTDLTPAEREEFLRWALSWKDYAPPRTSKAERQYASASA